MNRAEIDESVLTAVRRGLEYELPIRLSAGGSKVQVAASLRRLVEAGKVVVDESGKRASYLLAEGTR